MAGDMCKVSRGLTQRHCNKRGTLHTKDHTSHDVVGLPGPPEPFTGLLRRKNNKESV